MDETQHKTNIYADCLLLIVTTSKRFRKLNFKLLA